MRHALPDALAGDNRGASTAEPNDGLNRLNGFRNPFNPFNPL